MPYWLTDAAGCAYNADPIDDLDDAIQGACELHLAQHRSVHVQVRTASGQVVFVIRRKRWRRRVRAQA